MAERDILIERILKMTRGMIKKLKPLAVKEGVQQVWLLLEIAVLLCVKISSMQG